MKEGGILAGGGPRESGTKAGGSVGGRLGDGFERVSLGDEVAGRMDLSKRSTLEGELAG